MILSIVRTGFMNLRRDRGALTLSFIVPIAFFSIFAGIFGSRNGGTDPIRIAVVDEDHTELSKRLVEALQTERGLRAETGPAATKGAPLAPTPFADKVPPFSTHRSISWTVGVSANRSNKF